MTDPTAEVDAYVRSKQMALGRALTTRAKVYLDMNFWIVVRDAALALRTDPPALKLLHHLRRGVSQGHFICPVGDAAFMELLKQPFSADRRLGTARMVDELSLGVALVPSRPRTGTEIYQVLHRLLGQPEPLAPMQELVWTKVCHILGPSYPVDEEIEPALMVALQKKTMDSLWEASLTEMLEQAGDQAEAVENYRTLTDDTNRQRDHYADEMTSYEVAYDAELRGAIEAFGELTANILCDLGKRAGVGQPPPQGSAARNAKVNSARNTLYHVFKNQNAATTVRTIHIETALHASLRFDRKRRFKPNDWHDFRHAAAALAYCDVFLTESPLHELVSRPQLGLLGINGCRIASRIDDAVEILRTLAASLP